MKTTLPYWLLAAALAVGCQRSPLVEELTAQEGDAQIALKLNTTEIWEQVASKSYGLTPVQEKALKSIDILIFDASQRLVSRNRLEASAGLGLTHTIDTKSGSGMSIYVVANATLIANTSGAATDPLGRATFVDSLKNIKVANLLVDAATNQTLMMYGVAENVTINPAGGNTITIPLDYVAAKVTVNLYATLPVGQSFELVDWRIGSLPRYSYLFPKGLIDAGNPANAADFATQSTGNAWGDATIEVGGVATPVKTTTFYLFENRRGVVTNSDPKLKSGSIAPAAATHLLARGFYNTGSAVTGIDIKVMLGENSTNNYDIKRKSEYIYNIKVAGINDISVDTRFKDAQVGFQTEIVNQTLDAHYDMRPIKIGAYPSTSTITILDENGLPTTSTFWLKLSKKNITKFIDNGSGTFVRPTYNPATEMLQTEAYTHPATTGMDFTMHYLYADEFLTDNGTRTAKVMITNTSAPTAPVTYTITQRGALSAGRVGMRVIDGANLQTNSDYTLVTEIFEEATMAITPGNLANERTLTMQWGNTNLSAPLPFNDHTRRDGFDNTQKLVLSDITNGVLYPPYGRTGSGTISHATYDPIYNTNGSRYCFEKNRDTDGDGVIKGSEIKWYLPSPDEQLLIMTADNAWSTVLADRWTVSNIYLSSTQYVLTTNAMVARLSTGLTGTVSINDPFPVRCVRQLPAPLLTSPYVETGTQVVNNSGFKTISIRPTPLTRPTPMHTQGGAVNLTFPTRFVVAKADVAGGAKMWAEANGYTPAANSVVSGGVVSAIPIGCKSYFEVGGAPASIPGNWRLPTQREMSLIAAVKLELLREVAGFSALTGTYWCATQSSATMGWAYNFLFSAMYPRAKTTAYQIRCVRDL